MTSLSVLVPVYDEERFVAPSRSRLEILETSPLRSRVRVMVVDDCSRDGTAEAVDRSLPFTSLSLIAVSEKTAAVEARRSRGASPFPGKGETRADGARAVEGA